MNRILRFVAAALVVTAAVPAMAQVQTGSILVKAADQQGAVVPGVTITISSPVLVAGTMTAVTDAGGVYRFPSLVPGTYGVKIEQLFLNLDLAIGSYRRAVGTILPALTKVCLLYTSPSPRDS